MMRALALTIAIQASIPSAQWSAGGSPVAPSPTPAIAAPAGGASAAPSASPSPTATPITSWLGVTLGEPSKAVRATLGRPLEIVPTNVGDEWRYAADNGNATLELVLVQDQVLNIAVRVKPGKTSKLADPAGGALGMTAADLTAARGVPIATYDNGDSVAYGDVTGVRCFYSLENGVVTSIEISEPLPSPPPATVTADANRDGSSLARAFLVAASTSADATAAELAYIHGLTCDNASGLWTLSTQELVSSDGRYYDLYHVTCSTTKLPHDFYFDVTESYGK
ncbi:MAG TPA: hypothetical protein VEJ20_00855 [Candidatus Eremiobacteraceae bacterium]|nr:hypothetical protein [Candidatus Eremiobacteraceae bacterium]